MDIKSALLNKCKELIDSKISIAEKAMNDAQNSANNEDKSTAGDKFDTARAMSHIERDMYAKQLIEAVQLKKCLAQISLSTSSNEINLGSLVYTQLGIYFIAIGLGKVSMDAEDYLLISAGAPIGQQLFGKKPGDTFIFQGKTIQILKVK
jgi:hypothetical protein